MLNCWSRPLPLFSARSSTYLSHKTIELNRRIKQFVIEFIKKLNRERGDQFEPINASRPLRELSTWPIIIKVRHGAMHVEQAVLAVAIQCNYRFPPIKKQ